uniref:Flagellar FliJ protein n=1 Tax=Magnetococcus massalia (strain MO-1) TaxID=451514 RepID=A0A1S7LM11_MAGMO|nr:putative Flagellar export protein FliJ [Candidatus Magnetococcus massalia]
MVELRHLREESLAGAYARVLADLNSLQQQLMDLRRDTEQGRADALNMVGGTAVMTGDMLQGFFLGQKHREQQLQQAIVQSETEVEEARLRWVEAKKELQQVEKLADKTDKRLHTEAVRAENQVMDMTGMVRYHRRQNQEGLL